MCVLHLSARKAPGHFRGAPSGKTFFFKMLHSGVVYISE